MNPTKISSKTIFEYILLTLIAVRSDPTVKIAERLDKIGFTVPLGSLYPILSELHQKKMLGHGYEEMDDTSPRKTYSITEKGKERLLTLEHAWTNLNRIILRAEVKH